jgi:hypothetical protein
MAAIPFKELGFKKAPTGKKWFVNFCRSEKENRELSTWNASYRRFNEPYSFGELIFGK